MRPRGRPLRTLAALGLAFLLGTDLSRADIPAGTLVIADIEEAYPKDFAMAKREGLFHVFYIKATPAGDLENLGHQSSPDLYHWTLHPDLLVDGRTGWNKDFVWAPSIIERGGVYSLFYTGVRRRQDLECPGSHFQQIGIATSTDLFSWDMEIDPAMTPAQVPWTIPPADSCVEPWFGNFRDPFVMQDPVSGEWLLYYVTVANDTATRSHVPGAGPYDPSRFVVGMAHAPALFASGADWSDFGAIWATHAAFPGGGGFSTWESPHLFRRAWQGQDLWFLFASVGQTSVDRVAFMTSPSATLPNIQKRNHPGWTWRGQIADLGIQDSYGNPLQSGGWFATEYFRDPESGLEYFANVKWPRIEFRQLRWRTTSDGFDLEQPFRLTTIEVSQATVSGGDLITARLLARNGADGVARTFALEALRVGAADESLGVIAPGLLGLPDSIAVASDSTALVWTFPSALPAGTRFRIRIAPPNQAVSSPVITVLGGSLTRRPRTRYDAEPETIPPAGVQTAVTLFVASHPAPSPTLQLELSREAEVRLDLFDASGRRVRTLLSARLPGGITSVAWRGDDDDGRPLANGLYLARAETAIGVVSARVVLIR